MRLFILATVLAALVPRPALAESICRELYAPDFGSVAQSFLEPSFLITPNCQSSTLTSPTHGTHLALRVSASAPFTTTTRSTHLPPCPIIPLTVLFDFDQAEIRFNDQPILDQIPAGCNVWVEGHTCDLGPESYNLDLSRRRAEGVATYLKARGVNVVRQRGLGACCPTATEQASNRRVVIGPAEGNH